MNPHHFGTGYQQVYQIFDPYQAVLPQFQIIQYPLSNTAIPNAVQSITKTENIRAKNMLCITDPNTLNVIVPSELGIKGLFFNI